MKYGPSARRLASAFTTASFNLEHSYDFERAGSAERDVLKGRGRIVLALYARSLAPNSLFSIKLKTDRLRV